MEISKAVEIIDRVTASVSGNREDHKIITEAIQSVITTVQEYFKQKEEIVELCKENEILRTATKDEADKETAKEKKAKK